MNYPKTIVGAIILVLVAIALYSLNPVTTFFDEINKGRVLGGVIAILFAIFIPLYMTRHPYALILSFVLGIGGILAIATGL